MMNTMRKNWLTALLILVILQIMMAGEAEAVKTEFSGQMEAQVRWFPSSPVTPPASLVPPSIAATVPEQSTGVGVSFALKPEWKYLTEDRRHDFKITPFVRYDSHDTERTHVDMRELYWLYHGDEWEILAGIDQVFWGVTESRHLVDIINQTDLVEDPDEEDKLGQPMVRLTMELAPALTLARVLKPSETKRNWGKLTLFLMPGFRERTFPGSKGRLRGPFPIDEKATIFSGDASRDRVDLALRYSHHIDKWDIGLHYFHGNSREPRLVQKGLALIMPEYKLINQVGADIQYTSGPWLGKFEGIVREGQGDFFGALVAGVEYTWYQVLESDTDVGFLTEYLYDNRDRESAPPTIFNNDIFVGTRLSFNDVKNTQLLAGAVIDRNSRAYSFSLEAERRINNNISAELVARLFGNAAGPKDVLFGLKKDDYVQLSLFYHF